MRQNCYECIFRVTETLQNGKERTIKKSVLSPIFRTVENGKQLHITEAERAAKGSAILKEMHYYNIEYLETKCKTLIWTD